MKKFHVAIGVTDIARCVKDYNRRLGQEADLVIPNQYALWRTQTLNLSIRKVSEDEAGKLRHLGWENSEASEFSSDYDCNNILWEEFTQQQQAQEIEGTWPGSYHKPSSDHR